MRADTCTPDRVAPLVEEPAGIDGSDGTAESILDAEFSGGVAKKAPESLQRRGNVPDLSPEQDS